MSTKPEILDTKTAAKTRLFKVEQVHLRFSNGEERVYERLQGRSKSAVVLVPILNGDTLLLVKEYGCGIHDYYLGLPVGAVDDTDGTYLEAANRELKEEVGYGANKLTELKELSTAPGYSTGRIMIVLAEDLYPERLPGDEPEPIEVVPWPLAKFSELLESTDFLDAKSFAALCMVREILNAR